MNGPVFRSCVMLTMLLFMGTSVTIAGPESVEVDKVEYLQGVPGQDERMRGSLKIGPETVEFVYKGKLVFAINGEHAEYVAAQAKASIRARTADTGAVAMGLTGAVIPGAFLFGFAFLPEQKHLLSIEYLEEENQSRRLALFNVRGHSALAVKKIIDDAFGLTSDYYRKKDREEEERTRRDEMEKTPAGFWEAARNTMAGDSRYDRFLLEKGRYKVLIFNKYVGFCPEDMKWAKYRMPICEVKPDRSADDILKPVYKSSRLVGFKYKGVRYKFY